MEIKELIKQYSDNPYVRSIVQLIPNFGGAIDTLLCEKGNKWRQERMEIFLKTLNEKLENIIAKNTELKEKIKSNIDSEDFYYYFIKCAQESTQSINREKIKLFCGILSNSLLIDENDESNIELFLNLTKELTVAEVKELSCIKHSDKYFYVTNQGFYVDLDAYKKDINEKRLMYLSDVIPDEYHISSSLLFTISRLEKSMLVNRRIYEQFGSISVGWSTGFQSYSSQIGFREKVVIEISDFGRKYSEWIIES